MPWVRIEKSYVFDGPEGEVILGDLFEGRSQLAIYHFMLTPDSDQKFFSFFRSIASLIQGNGFSTSVKTGVSPI